MDTLPVVAMECTAMQVHYWVPLCRCHCTIAVLGIPTGVTSHCDSVFDHCTCAVGRSPYERVGDCVAMRGTVTFDYVCDGDCSQVCSRRLT